MEPITLGVAALAEAARRHNVAPVRWLEFPFASPLGDYRIIFQRKQQTDGSSDGWLSCWLFWGGPKEAALANASCAFELAAVKESGCSELLGGDGGCVGDLWQRGFGWGSHNLCEWSRVRSAVLDGCSLQVTVLVLPAREAAATLDTALHVPSTPSDFSTLLGAMLDGPFTDVALTAGGRTFRAHRVVLAAASPVFLSMLDSAMREACEAAVELVGADAGVVELLLRHLYGATIEVPVSLALQLYALAYQYQVAAVLQQRLRLWLMVLQLAPEALCELVPAAWTLSLEHWWHGLRFQAAEVLDQLSPLAAFAAWPVDAVVEVIKEARTLPAFIAAVAWMEAQPRPSKRRRGVQHVWPRLLGAVQSLQASRSDLWAIRNDPSAAGMPGLERWLLWAYDSLCLRLEVGAAQPLVRRP